MGLSKKIIKVSLPKNLSEQDKHLYQPYLSYKLSPLKIKKLNDVFVTYSGLCLDDNGLISDSHHDYPCQHADYLNEAAHYYYDVEDHPENLLTLDDDRTYLLIHHPWFNYYHWLCEPILRLWTVRGQLDEMTLLLPDYYEKTDFIMGSLEPFKIKDVFFIPAGKSLLVKNLCLPQIKPVCDAYHAPELHQIRSFYRSYVLTEKFINIHLGDRLYLSRELAKRRKVLNEPDVVKVLQKYGFTIFHPEDYSFLEQVSIFSNTKFLVSTHGAGLTNMLFMDQNASVLELHKSKTNELNHPSFAFWYLAEALGHNYYHQVCSPVNAGGDDYFTGDYIIDVDLLDKNLALMLRES